MFVVDYKTASSVSGGSSRPVDKSEDSTNVLSAKRLHDCVGSYFGRFEMHGDGLIAPGIFQLVTSIGDVDKLHAELASCVLKTSRLVAELGGEKQQPFGMILHRQVTFFTNNGALQS